jgi:hypothetical protein
MQPVCGSTVTRHSIDTDKGRMSHGWGSDIAERVVVGPLSLPAADAEPSGFLRSVVAIRRGAPLGTQCVVATNVEAEREIVRVEIKRSLSSGREVLRLINLD